LPQIFLANRRDFLAEQPAFCYKAIPFPTPKMKGLSMQHALVLVAALLLTPLTVLHAVEVRDLRCESRENPLGIDVAKPRLSSILGADWKTAFS